MFIGHFGIGFGAKSKASKVSLGTLFLAAQFIDLLWPTFLLLGWEQVGIKPGLTTVNPLDFTYYPFSHSLLAVLGWALLLGGLYFWVNQNKVGSLVVGLLVVSHWVLDLLVHTPDLPLSPANSIMVGLGLWNSLIGTIVVEGCIFAVGLLFYLRATKANDKVGRYGLWGLAGFLVLVYAGNFVGSPPPDVTAIAWVGQLQWLVVAWGYWVDKHRRIKNTLLKAPTPKRA